MLMLLNLMLLMLMLILVQQKFHIKKWGVKQMLTIADRGGGGGLKTPEIG